MIELRGAQLHLHPVGEAVSDHIRRAGDFYEATILDDLRALQPQHQTIVDAGANIGNHSVYWAELQHPQRIMAFEPLPANFELLRSNLRPYAFADAYRLALSDARGKLTMDPYPSNMGRSAIVPEGQEEVSARTLDSFALTDVTLLKIDVEGHQRRLLAGAQATLARCRPLVLIEDEALDCGDLLPGYTQVMAWPGANYLWQSA